MLHNTKRSPSNWIQTFSGKAFYPLDPQEDDIDIRDIAHALAYTCRFAGHVTRFYSVAEHSVYVACYCSPQNAMCGLLHDASEAYIADIPRPIKPYLANYAAIEDHLMTAIAAKFDLSWPMPSEVKEIDGRILSNEKAALLGPAPQPWTLYGDPLPDLAISGWTPAEAEIAFLMAYNAFGGNRYGME